MKARGADARGVAVIDASPPESELDSMDRAGIRGIRLNLATGGTNDPTVARQRLREVQRSSPKCRKMCPMLPLPKRSGSDMPSGRHRSPWAAGVADKRAPR